MSKTIGSDPTIDPAEVAARRDDEELFVLDVRREDDFEEWRVAGSYNLPIYDELLDGDTSGLEAALEDIPEDREIAVVCVAGVTSADAARFLRERGYDARSMADGMNGWGRLHVTYDVDGESGRVADASEPTRGGPAVDGVTQIVRPGTGCVSYLVESAGEGIVVDPSLYVEEYRDLADERGVDVVGAVDTHAHADHVSGGRVMAREWGVPYYLHGGDGGELDEFEPIADGDAISVGDRELEVLHTPGHTPGSVSLRWGDGLLSGDTLFIRSVGRPDLEGETDADVREGATELFESLERLAALPDDTVVLPGHMSDETIRPLATTLGELEADNELFGEDDRDAFVETIVGGLSDEPANYNRIKAINWGEEPLTEEAKSLELGPNNCAAN
ncbi:MBL fold metallo-hydrolase [Halovivax limisalsi]|uniref:MBL fold metallo-hydrolase n=1 Tax=Halovivax limisalsi TaxID=1453760 RepID=UPI001FFD4209|nr:MBL fold metallo-hydrolase [Halovivax limisalsi]